MTADRRHAGLAAIVVLATVAVVALAAGIAAPARRPAGVEHAAPKRPSLHAAPAGDVAALNAAFSRRVPAALAADLLPDARPGVVFFLKADCACSRGFAGWVSALAAHLDTAAATATLFLENFRPERPLHVLGPATGVAVQRDGRWESLPTGASQAARDIRRVGADRLFMPISFALPAGPYDELLRGYIHVRISASLVVGDRDDGTGDLFERSDAYYVYLRDPRLTEDAIRAANGWGAKAAVPLWIPMPAH